MYSFAAPQDPEGVADFCKYPFWPGMVKMAVEVLDQESSRRVSRVQHNRMHCCLIKIFSPAKSTTDTD